MNDTIAAISTGLINQPISIIRISGSEAFSLVKKIFNGAVGTNKTITYGFICEKEQKIDEVLVAWFKGPNSFTGEDIVEINAHGGVVNTNKILKLLLVNGARLAERGEFSRRAFLNGKMDLIKAEAIHELIFSKTEEQTKMAIKKFDGRTSGLIYKLQNEILNIIATIETNIDYPEYEDIESITNETLIPKLLEVETKLKTIITSSKSSRYIFEGVKVVIVGKPNVGKSSLLNAFLNTEKAIVSNVPGTTRDVVEGNIQVGQVMLHFMDTAGIHQTNDQIENYGIQKSFENIDNADLIIHLLDATKKHPKEDTMISERLKDKEVIQVFNKKDLKIIPDNINVSAKNKDIDDLIKAIIKKYATIKIDDYKALNNLRQLSLIEKALNNIKDAIDDLKAGFEPSVVIIKIRSSWENLGNILGNVSQEDLLDAMFKNFCLGK